MNYLLIVESPSKCQKIESYLNSGQDKYKCIASKGHIRNVENGLKSIHLSPDELTIDFSIIKEKKKHVDEMKKIISKYSHDNIFIATDADREGEAIGWHICIVFDLPISTTKRIVFQEITKTAICNAVRSPQKINMNMVYSQQARQVLDLLIGYKISPFLWKYVYNDKTAALSAGRCQTPALFLCNVPVNTKSEFGVQYKTTASFTSYNLLYFLESDACQLKEESVIMDFLETSKTFQHKWIGLEEKKDAICFHSPSPFNTSSLLQCAASSYGLSPKQTMQLCGELYQEGFITYMRTENTKYSVDFVEKAASFFEKKRIAGSMRKKEEIINTDSINPHEAIRPTNIETECYPGDGHNDPKKELLYRLIWKNTVRSCLRDALFQRYSSYISSAIGGRYIYNLDIPKTIGWKIVDFIYPHDRLLDNCRDIEDEPEESNIEKTNSKETFEQFVSRKNGILFFLKSNQSSIPEIKLNSVIVSPVVVETSQIKKPKRYGEASLIKELEAKGIGRPSTFSGIVETIQGRGYVKKKNIEGTNVTCNEFFLSGRASSKKNEYEISKKQIVKKTGYEKGKLVIEPVGILVADFLMKNFNEIFSYDYTKQMEDKLDVLHEDPRKYFIDVCLECQTHIAELSKKMNKLGKKTYKIDDKWDLTFNKNGPVLKRANIEDDSSIYKFKTVKKEILIDFARLEKGEYALSDLAEIEGDGILGKFGDHDVFLKSGPYGMYIECDGVKKSWKDGDDFLKLLSPEKKNVEQTEKQVELGKGIVRIIDTDISIRKGKYGNYIYFKDDTMNTPRFIQIPSKLKKKIMDVDSNEIKKLVYL